MTTRPQLRDLVARVLTGATDAGGQVYTPRDWATWPALYPVILVRAPREEKESLGRATIEFTVTATIQIVAKVEVPAGVADYGGELAEDALERIELQILGAIVNNPVFTAASKGSGRLISQFASIRSQIDISPKGETHLGELLLEIAMEFYQGPEDFFPPAAVPLREIGIHADLVNRFDPTATFSDPAFPASVVPAPRASGPDGRDEGAVLIELP